MHGYLVTNLVTGLRYVGVTVQQPPIKRWKRHISEAKHFRGPPLLHAAMREHGLDAFTFEIVATYDTPEAMLQGERDMIAQYGTLDPKGYNRTVGGQGTSGYKWSDEARARLSAKTKGRSMAHATAASVATNRGKSLSPEHREKIALAQRGKSRGPMSDDAKRKMSISQKRRAPRSIETCEKIRRNALQRWSDPQRRKAMSAFASGRIRATDGTFAS